MYHDPRFPLKVPVPKVTGTQYHNTGSVTPAENFGNNMEPTAENPQTSNSEYSFIESAKKHRKHRTHLRKGKASHKKQNVEVEDIRNIKDASIGEAADAERRAGRLLDAMTVHPEGGDGSMILGIDLQNKRDPSIRLHQNNVHLAKSMEFWKNRPQGIRAMHTRSFLPKK
mmetsp:Transcript_23099/g.24042  ORF Transcript_23099/g.24042 Transcript_23099/m.24042 type:complete len:170 (+) Transcript_23099:486-995(+)